MNGGRFALNVLLNHTGGVPRPDFCTYLVSFRCNARCGMCDSWRMKPGAEMSVSDAARVFAKLGKLAVVRLSGGEPFLRDDFSELAGAVDEASNPTFLHITTNGSFPERIEAFLDGFAARKKLRLMVSLDGLKSEHDRSRGADVTFDTALESVERILRFRKHGVHVAVNHTVISRRSLEDSEGLRDLFGSKGVDVQAVLAYADSSMYAIKLRGRRATHLIVPEGYPLHPDLAGADVLGFVDDELVATGRIKDRFLRIGKRYYLRGLKERLEGRSAPRYRPRCVALRSHIRLLPDGRVPVCQFNTETVGSLLTRSLDDVLGSNEAVKARKWVDACPGCWAECEVMPSSIFTGDILRGALPESA